MTSVKKYTLAPVPQTSRGESIKLGTDPKGKHFLYTNGKSVFIRDIENPTLATEYTGHKFQATVARYSPSGFYIASGDIHGNVRIWDTVNEDHLLKNEIRPISGKVSDIAWDCDSKRIIAVGEGKERFGHAFLFDTLSSVGEITGHSKMINSVSIRQQRPFRSVTASDDMTVAFSHGVPFKYDKTIRDHTRFVHAVQFSPNGDHFVSAGADGKMFLYDGKTGDKVEELTCDERGHSGGIFSVAWSPDSTQLLSSSADCTAKIWDISTKKVVNTFEFGTSIDDQQVGNLWQGDWLISTSLSGEFNYLDKNSGKVSRHVDGHSKAITALAVTPDDTLFTGSYDGRVYGWSYGDEKEHTKAVRLDGEGHANQVTSLAVSEASLFSVAMDDTLRKRKIADKALDVKTISTNGLPRSLAVSEDGWTSLVTTSNVQIYDTKDLQKLEQHDQLDFTPTVIDVKKDQVLIGGEDSKVRVYVRKDGKLSLTGELTKNMGQITALAIHPTEDLVAVGDSVGKIYLYEVASTKVVVQNWVFHSGRITQLQWSPCGMFLVSGSLDTNVYVWNRAKPFSKVAIKNAHVDAVNGVAFLNKQENDSLQVVSVGQDAAIHIYSITKPQ
ncbi:WD40-repeat-containing domain protein [Halteromyces radiatus]|uniref:WD40-repeat-containing domain protein n=1 Tax=Halteromyces radiatus TaxID=101107 RepID=UPI00221E752A|nr:WD40-repeat-containing domain protein [Halteromyces radiatus]KAI8086324.1 WD40-repeat-containing domain protein [Halteromyces radiatus]